MIKKRILEEIQASKVMQVWIYIYGIKDVILWRMAQTKFPSPIIPVVY